MCNSVRIVEMGKRIRIERERKGYTLEQLAEKINSTRQSVSKWEKGLGVLDVDSIIRLSDIFGCDAGYLLCEYECRTKANTDIVKTTGLSEDAVGNLILHKENSNYALNEMLSKIVEDPTFWEALLNIYEAVLCAEKVDSFPLTDLWLSAVSQAGKSGVVFMSTIEAIDFYKNNACRGITRVIDTIVNKTIVDHGIENYQELKQEAEKLITNIKKRKLPYTTPLELTVEEDTTFRENLEQFLACGENIIDTQNDRQEDS